MSRPAPGTFRIYPYAQPPLKTGRYVVDGEIEIPDPTFDPSDPDSSPEVGEFAPLLGAIDVVGPRYQLPPDQVLSTYPPAGSRGAFSRRLPQIVLKRRTIPWEWSNFPASGATPVPWLALVLIAPGEGTVRADQPIADCVTPGVTMPNADIFDTPKASCLEVPESVVKKTFPAKSDLSLLAHVREVDMTDTELAMGDDDGWLAVILCNRLPQAGVTYTACLINVDQQTNALPTNPAVQEDFDPFEVVFDAGVFLQYADDDTTAVSQDAVSMGKSDVKLVANAGIAANFTAKTGAAGAVWAAGTKHDASATTVIGEGKAVQKQEMLGIFDFPYHLVEKTRRFPVLTSWSFTCEGDGDFATLANDLSSRLLGYVAEGPEDPDGGPRTKDLPKGALPESPANRPLPLVTESGHIVTAYRTRVGEDQQAYFRGPFIPNPADRPAPGDDDGRVALAHHADQLRLVVPDGMQDLTYASAFEIGRLLALSRPGAVAMLAHWRREKFRAAAAAAVDKDVIAKLPKKLCDRILLDDPLRMRRPVGRIDLPGPVVDPIERPPTARQFVRGMLSVLADSAVDVAAPLPETQPAFARDNTTKLTRSRAQRIAQGLAIDADLADAAESVAVTLMGLPVATVTRDRDADLAGARVQLEGLVGELMDGVQLLDSGDIPVPNVFGRMR